MMATEVDATVVESAEQATAGTCTHPQSHHVERKPLWWRRQAGRRGTKGQRATLRRMENLGYVLEKKKYKPGVEGYSLVDLFAKSPGKSTASHDRESTNADMVESEMEFWLEIGFGRGENILTNAHMHPDRCYIGADVHQPGTCTVLGRIEDAIESGKYWDGATMFAKESKQADIHITGSANHRPYDNVRIYCGDGIKFLHLIPSHSLSGIILPFPDPFPNTTPYSGHEKFRVIQPSTLQSLERVLKPGGAFYLATDAIEFFEWCCGIFESHGRERGWQEVVPCPDRTGWLGAISYYEQKGFDEGRSTHVRCWRCPTDN